MILGRIRHDQIMIPLTFFMMILLAGISHGEGTDMGAADLPQDYFLEGVGEIERLATNEIVINDRLFILSPSTVFNTPTMKNAPRSWFHEGNIVRYFVNKNREIKSLLLIKKK